MRFLKPLLAGAALLTLTVPALASAQSYYGDRGYSYGDRGDYGYRDEAPRWQRHYDYRDSWRRRDHHRRYDHYDRYDRSWR